jgi:diguanylate cyclase (GGDEF)-like protein
MAQPRDYRKPRNQEMRDLLVHLPHPVRVLDSAGALLWQNEAAERLQKEAASGLQDEPAWQERATTWQGHKARLATALPGPDRPSPRLAELEAENERLRRQQRDTARRKKKAEDTARQSEKAAGQVEKREQKLRRQLEQAEGRISELEQAACASVQGASFEEVSLEPAGPEGATSPKGKGRAKGKSKSKTSQERWERDKHALDQRLAELSGQLEGAHGELERWHDRHGALKAEYDAFRQETEEQESARRLEEQLAAKVREFEELERAFEEEQKALVAQKQDLELRLSEQEQEFSRLKDTVRGPSSKEQPVLTIDRQGLEELRGDLQEAKTALAESTRREIRLAERLESASELKEEQSKVLALVKDELNELRGREKELRETLKLYGDFRQELEQARSDAKRYKTETQELRQATEALEARLLESRRELAEARSAGPAAGVLGRKEPAPPDAAGGSSTVRSQLEFAQSRLRETEKQLDETREALKKARTEAQASKDTEKLAFQDSLTGLPNRHIVDRYLDFSHKQARATSRAYSLFLIDIDGFRVLNDTFGREWGDALLKAVAERLAGMRGANHVFARHSQDRFLLLASDLLRPAAEKFVEDACKSLLGALAHPFEVKGEQIRLSASIGIGLGPGPVDDPKDMFSQAEVALDTAKARGPGSYFLHNEALLQKTQREATYLRQMEHAIERHEFHAVYQPVFSLSKGLATGAELLLRWRHRDQRTLKPEDFLEVALRSGLIFSIAEAIWPKAFKALARWRKLRPGFTLSINLSDRELLNPLLVERAVEWARAASVQPQAILFEVRDASRLRVSAVWWTVLEALHQAGFGLVLDDYGSEASLFGTLAYGGFSQAKISVDERNPICTPAPHASKGLRYCAKRIQSRFDQKALKKAGFDLAQGFAVAQPLDEDDVDGVLGR